MKNEFTRQSPSSSTQYLVRFRLHPYHLALMWKRRLNWLPRLGTRVTKDLAVSLLLDVVIVCSKDPLAFKRLLRKRSKSAPKSRPSLRQ